MATRSMLIARAVLNSGSCPGPSVVRRDWGRSMEIGIFAEFGRLLVPLE